MTVKREAPLEDGPNGWANSPCHTMSDPATASGYRPGLLTEFWPHLHAAHPQVGFSAAAQPSPSDQTRDAGAYGIIHV